MNNLNLINKALKIIMMKMIMMIKNDHDYDLDQANLDIRYYIYGDILL